MPSKLIPLSRVVEDYWSDITRVESSKTRGELEVAVSRFQSHLGFDSFGYATRERNLVTDGYHYFHNFEGPYGRYRYDYVYRYEPETDPVLVHLNSGLPPSAFSCRDGMDSTGGNQSMYKTILSSAAEHGIRAGIGVPITGAGLRWGFLLLTTNDTDRVADVRDYLPHLSLFSQFTYSVVQRLATPTRKSPEISEREREVLRWASIGKTSWEIGLILSIGESTVNFHLANAAKRLGTRGRRATCARAVAEGLVSI